MGVKSETSYSLAHKVMSPSFSKQLIKQIESDICRYTSPRHPHDPDIESVPGPVLNVRTKVFPIVQMSIVFSETPIFAVVRYAHVAKPNEGKPWTRRILLKVEDGDHFCFADQDTDTRYHDMPTLSQELLMPLMDVNFKPPEK